MERQDDLEEKVDAAAGDMEAELADMEHRSEEVGEDIDDARSEWEQKRNDPSVPGAEPREAQEAEADAAQEAEADAADDDADQDAGEDGSPADDDAHDAAPE